VVNKPTGTLNAVIQYVDLSTPLRAVESPLPSLSLHPPPRSPANQSPPRIPSFAVDATINAEDPVFGLIGCWHGQMQSTAVGSESSKQTTASTAASTTAGRCQRLPVPYTSPELKHLLDGVRKYGTSWKKIRQS